MEGCKIIPEKYNKELLSLARESVISHFDRRSLEHYDYLRDIPELQISPGVFVTIHIKRDEKRILRGCIGNIIGRMDLIDSVIKLARSSAFEDFRFQPLSYEETNFIDFEISLLSTPEPVASIEDIVTGRHGVILSYKGRGAVFLPQVAVEQGWDREQLLCALSQKAGLYEFIWQELECELEVFEASVFGEEL